MKKKKIALLTMATAFAIPVLVAPAPSEAASVKTFKDIPSTHPYFDMINDMAGKGIISGYEDGTFRPAVTLNRAHAALLIARALETKGITLKKVTTFNEAKDVTKNHIYYDDLKTIVEAGLLTIDNKGYLNPTKPLTRGEMAKILTVAFDLKVKADYVFEDVKGTAYEEYVKALYSNGITAGYEDATFKVDEPLNRSHYALFMYRAMNVDPNFVPKPIPTPPTDLSEYPSDKVVTEGLHPKDLETPNGQSAVEILKKQQAEAQKLDVEIGVSATTMMTMWDEEVLGGYTFKEAVAAIGRLIGKSASETTQIINYSYATGKVFKGDNFYIYFNFVSNGVAFGYK